MSWMISSGLKFWGDLLASWNLDIQISLQVWEVLSHYFFWLFRAAPSTCGGSQARGLIEAVAASPHHSSWQRQILNPLSDPPGIKPSAHGVFITSEPWWELPLFLYINSLCLYLFFLGFQLYIYCFLWWCSIGFLHSFSFLISFVPLIV